MSRKPLQLWRTWVARWWALYGGLLLLLLFLGGCTLPPFIFMFVGYAYNGLHGAVSGLLLGIVTALIGFVLFQFFNTWRPK